MKELNERELNIIERNLKAFQFNFTDEIKILKCNKHYYIYKAEEIDEQYSNYIYNSHSIENINGWLYGAVQTACKMIK